MYDTLGTLLRTDPNMAVRVSKVVIVIVTRPKIEKEIKIMIRKYFVPIVRYYKVFHTF